MDLKQKINKLRNKFGRFDISLMNTDFIHRDIDGEYNNDFKALTYFFKESYAIAVRLKDNNINGIAYFIPCLYGVDIITDIPKEEYYYYLHIISNSAYEVMSNGKIISEYEFNILLKLYVVLIASRKLIDFHYEN